MSLFLNIINSNFGKPSKSTKINDQVNNNFNNISSSSINTNSKWAPIILYRYYCIPPCYI
ncbi:hypothetical protein DDB_G0271810 [Dictyostelium discoideum AX4]|uniref:Uncharacterized protein n=1 Tax=Dictyostelium discoideum TaxID=44689 RepID=Q55AN4_DICDI|nr:hypothetical protein DDB_G0271810 [Dictyostelium discoideum AX4]EAL71595.1 hypothetical protein DDB_G0271810 [Dictyostelium discoideum AX4]|eukprot:XP_645488.1 hypothetical protein DDB_G0271810 [Dictyostelium discoideum AX4]